MSNPNGRSSRMSAATTAPIAMASCVRPVPNQFGPSLPRDEFYSQAEVAACLGMCVRTLQRLRTEGNVAATKRRGSRSTRVIFTRDQAYAAIEKRRRGEI